MSERQRAGGHLEEPRTVADAERRPRADRRLARVGHRDHPVLHLERALLEVGHVLRGGEHDAHALDPRHRRELLGLPLVVGAVERREVVEHRERRLHAQQVLVVDARRQHVHEHLAVAQLGRHVLGLVEVERVLGRAVLLVADGGGGERREEGRVGVGRLDPALLLPQQVLRRVEARLAQPLLVAQPRVEARRVAHIEAGLGELGAAVLGVLDARLLHLLDDVHALTLALRPAEVRRELLLRRPRRVEPLAVVQRAARRVRERVVRLLHLAPQRDVAASVGVVEHSLLLVRVSDLRAGGASGWCCSPLVVATRAGARA